MNNDIDQARSINRLEHKQCKRRIYSLALFMHDLSNQIIKDQNEDRQQQFAEIISYLNRSSISELKQFCKLFSFSEYLNFVLTSNNENEKFLAFQILALVTDSGKADFDFFMEPRLFQYCISNILNDQFSPYVFKILINGSEYEEYSQHILSMDILDLLIQLPITTQISNLVSNLTYWPNIGYLEKFLTLCENFLNNTNINELIIYYLFKTIHHINAWENLSLSTIQEINSKFFPSLYLLAPSLLDYNEFHYINSVFRYFIHINEIQSDFAFSILRIFSQSYITQKCFEKTVKLGLMLFLKNSEKWKCISEINGQLLDFILNNSKEYNLEFKSLFFNAILSYYCCEEGVIDRFMKKVLEWCLMFVNDSTNSVAAIEQIVLIKKASKNDVEINLIIKENLQKIEELLNCNDNDEYVALLATELMELCQENEE